MLDPEIMDKSGPPRPTFAVNAHRLAPLSLGIFGRSLVIKERNPQCHVSRDAPRDEARMGGILTTSLPGGSIPSLESQLGLAAKMKLLLCLVLLSLA